MGWHRHTVLKCATCPKRRVLGGTKSSGGLSQTHGWKSGTDKKGGFVYYCPQCYKKVQRKATKPAI